jgi:hypothetical protein
MLGTANDEPSLLDLFPKVLSLLVDNWGVLGSTTDILEGYILLDANAVLQVRHAVVNVTILPSHCKSRDTHPSYLPRSSNL